MNLSINAQVSLFASFSSYFKAASWPTYSSMSCEAALKSEKNIPQSSLNLEFRPCQSPGIEIVGEGGSIERIQSPSRTTQSRELSHRSKSKFELDWGIHQKSKIDHLGIGS